MASEKQHAANDSLTLPSYAPELQHTPTQHRKNANKKLLTAIVLSFSVLAVTQLPVREALLRGYDATSSPSSTFAPPLGFPERIQRRWGQYSPYFPAGDYVPPPTGCEITQVNILQRHGARYPNDDDDYDLAVKHLRHAKEYRDSGLDFLKDYEYQLKVDVLVPYGAEQSFESGEAAYKRYSHLVSETNIPFVRAASKPRVVASAGNWTVGFAAASHHHYNPPLALILPESRNNTLNNECPAASDGLAEAHKWLRVFAPSIVERLHKSAKGSKVTEEDIHRLMALCPFETLAHERPSPFCGLFSDEEFRALEYFGDVEKYYKTG
ncbi:hypothetical protein EIP86_006931 [Pleurotus ostreatoroseus]|nr:hypothetical protein EIP86_006931 [Pleurotus ostreatoroseus]